VDITHFSVFDYAALGHLHGAQTCKSLNGSVVRYSGSPIAYSIAEANDDKSVTVVTMREKGNCTVEARPLIPYRRICCLRGEYETLMARDYYRDTDYRESYVQITLTDETDVPDALYRLRTVYPYLLRLEYDNSRTRAQQTFEVLPEAGKMDPETLFSAFYQMQNGENMTDDMAEYMQGLIARLWGGEKNA